MYYLLSWSTLPLHWVGDDFPRQLITIKPLNQRVNHNAMFDLNLYKAASLKPLYCWGGIWGSNPSPSVSETLLQLPFSSFE
ncbi:hypothetical protein IWX76_002516 [Pedobacter sp. CAN_A7]